MSNAAVPNGKAMSSKLKQWLVLLGVVAAAIVTGLIVYANYQKILYQNALGASAVLTAEYKAEKEKAEIQILALNAQLNTLAAEKDEALQSAAASQAHASSLAASLSQLQGETAVLPPDALTGRIASYIGAGNITLTGGGLFSLSRSGADSTYNIFLSADSLALQLDDCQSSFTLVSIALTASESTANAWATKYGLKEGEYQTALAAWAADKDALKHLERSMFGRRLKSFITGAAIGVASVLIFQLAQGK